MAAKDLCIRGRRCIPRASFSAVIAVVGTKSSLTSDTIVARKATIGAGGTVASPFIGALDPRMEIVGIHHVSDPREVPFLVTIPPLLHHGVK